MPDLTKCNNKIIFLKIKEFFLKNYIKLLIILVAIIVICVGIIIYSRYFRNTNIKPIIKNEIPSPGLDVNYGTSNSSIKTISMLDGREYESDVANRAYIAVMVENHSEARPQSGLDKASVVYEAIAEGGITRFMAIYGPQDATKVGPTRSARTYYLDWALEYGAYFAHVGGNYDALQLIPQIGIKDLDQFRYGTQAFWRVPEVGKATEHTMYTDTSKLRSIAGENGWNLTSDFKSIEYTTEDSPESRGSISNILIDYSTESYKVEWIYNKETNLYTRKIAGQVQKDAVSGNEITSKNIIIQKVERSPVITEINENGWSMKTIGEGTATIFLNGKKIDATWKKLDRNGITNFYDSNGMLVKFVPGVRWYEIVPPEISVTSK